MLKFILNFFRGSLTHVDGTSYADSSLWDFLLRSRQQPCCPLLKSLLWLCMLQVGAWVKLDQSWSRWCCFGFSPQLLTLLRLFLDVDMLLERSSLSVCSFRLIYWPVLWDQVQIVPILEIVVDTMALIDWGLFSATSFSKGPLCL